MLRFETAGRVPWRMPGGHADGLPAGIPISLDSINRELWRRQQGFGRGGRMKIETDRAEIVAGRAPFAHHRLADRHHHPQQGLEELDRSPAGGRHRRRRRQAEAGDPSAARAMPIWPARSSTISTTRATFWSAPARAKPRRGWRSARSPRRFSGEFGIEVLSHVIAVGTVRLERPAAWDELVALSQRDEVLLGCVDPEAEARMKEVVDQAYRTGDTVGGVFEVVAHGVPLGLGSHITWDTRLDGRLAQAIVSMQAVKGVEVGFAAEGAASFGSKVQDTIHYDREERALHARRQSRGRPGRRHDQRPGHPGARLAEADLDAAAAAGIGGSGDARTGAGGLRAQRRVRGAGGGRDRRGDGGDRAGAGVSRKIRRRFAGARRKRNYDGYLEQVKNF